MTISGYLLKKRRKLDIFEKLSCQIIQLYHTITWCWSQNRIVKNSQASQITEPDIRPGGNPVHP